MSFDLIEIWAHMSGLNKGIAIFLILMGVSCIAVAFDRYIAYLKHQKESQAFAKKAAAHLDSWELEQVIELTEKHKGSALARMVGPMLQRYLRGIEDPQGGMTPVEMARNEQSRRLEQVTSELKRGFTVLSSVASTAPFVGLLGTVVGIIAAFQGIGQAGSGGIGAVMTGISEALIETALGLLIAIPAVLVFNYLTGRVNNLELNLARSSSELLDEMENHYGRKAEPAE